MARHEYTMHVKYRFRPSEKRTGTYHKALREMMSDMEDNLNKFDPNREPYNSEEKAFEASNEVKVWWEIEDDMIHDEEE